MAQLFANAARSTLTASITGTSTQLQINPADQALFPVATGADWFKVALEDSSGNLEYMRVQRAVGQSLLTITERATEDATKFPARAFVAGSLVELRMTAADLASSIAHPSVGTGAHAATAISVTPVGGISASTVQAALQEIDAEKANAADVTAALAGKASTGANSFAGAQTLPGNAINALEAVPKQQLDAGLALFAGRNRIINGTFAVNQRAFAGGTIAAGVYGHDRWKAGAGGATYTVSGEVATITAGTLQQVIESVNVPEGGTYTLSWSGTAQARVDGGAYASSPVTVTGKAAAANTTIEFGTGTVTRVQYEAGATATAFERRHYTVELMLCQRYFWVSLGAVTLNPPASPPGPDWFLMQYVAFPVQMRAVPTVTAMFSSPANIKVQNLLNISPLGFQVYATSASASSYSTVYSAGNTATAEL